jgi:hypothetical protein
MEVSKPGVLACQAPGGFTVPGQIDDWKLVFHETISVTLYLSREMVHVFSETPKNVFLKFDTSKNRTR